MNGLTDWKEEADVVVVGYGGAGAVSAIAAHDAGARVLIVEKQPCDTPAEIKHLPSTRLSHGGWFCPPDAESAVLYLEGLVKSANEFMDDEHREAISEYSKCAVDNTDWMKSIGAEIEEPEFLPEFPDLPGANSCTIYQTKPVGDYRFGMSLFKYLSQAVEQRSITVMWESPAAHLVVENGEVHGVVVKNKGGEVRVRANRAVVLTCGGFEFNEWMKQNYLRVYPAYFNGVQANTGDGINMAMGVGAALWHMNAASWGVSLKFPDFPLTFSPQLHGEGQKGTIIVDKNGKRFSHERVSVIMHSFSYELTSYDSQARCYPRVPCYLVFDETRRKFGPLAGRSGSRPDVASGATYRWSENNQKEIERGWIIKGNTINELSNNILADSDNNGLIKTAVLEETIKQYNEYCRMGEDLEFHKPKELLYPLEAPPYYAMKLWPGGINTQGGPRRSGRAQVLGVDNKPIPRLYSAGELGSIFGMLYQLGGNLGECIAFGRIAGSNAAAEASWK